MDLSNKKERFEQTVKSLEEYVRGFVKDADHDLIPMMHMLGEKQDHVVMFPNMPNNEALAGAAEMVLKQVDAWGYIFIAEARWAQFEKGKYAEFMGVIGEGKSMYEAASDTGSEAEDGIIIMGTIKNGTSVLIRVFLEYYLVDDHVKRRVIACKRESEQGEVDGALMIKNW